MFHAFRLIRVAYTLMQHDALVDLMDIFVERPKALTKFRKIRKKSDSHLVEALEALGPSFIKMGQALATRPDIVGAEVALDLMRLQDQVPPFSGAEAKKIIAAELDAPLEDLFSDFEQEPVAAASIAQVHVATTKDGQKVAVKVLRPDIEKAFAKDISAFLWFARWIERFSSKARRLRPTKVVETIAEVIALEMDLRYEAAAASELKDDTAGNPVYHVPDVDWTLTSRRVLTTHWVDAIAFSKRDAIEKAGVDMKKLAENLVQSFLDQALNKGFFHADLHQGNLFAGKDGSITAIDFGIMGRLDKKTRRALAEILYGFLRRDYGRIARAHFEVGYVPKDQSLTKFTQALRAIGEQVVGRPVSEISAAKLLGQLFETTHMFNMPTQPQLILLQKTMVTVEGVALNIYPGINMWETSAPIVERWIMKNLSPQAKIKDGLETAFNTVARLPVLLDDIEAIAKMMRDGENTRRRSVYRIFTYGIMGGLIGAAAFYFVYIGLK